MGQTIRKESLTTEQIQEVLGELRTMDATVAIIVTASHYEEYVETTEDGQDDHARSSYKWVPWSGGGPPTGAVCGGEDQGGPVYVARAHHQGGLTPGKFHAKHKRAYISWGGQEPGCEVLVGCGLRWEGAEGGRVPPVRCRLGRRLVGLLSTWPGLRSRVRTPSAKSIQDTRNLLIFLMVARST